MEIVRTIKVKLSGLTSADAKLLSDTTEIYRQACNYVSQYIFDHEFQLTLSNYIGHSIIRCVTSSI